MNLFVSSHYHFFKCHCQHIFYIIPAFLLANFEMPFPRDPKTLSMGVLAHHQRLEAFAASREDVRCPRIRCRCSVSHGRTLDQISFTKKLGFLLLLLLLLHIERYKVECKKFPPVKIYKSVPRKKMSVMLKKRFGPPVSSWVYTCPRDNMIITEIPANPKISIVLRTKC